MSQEKQESEFSSLEKSLIATAIVFGILGILIFVASIFLFNNGESFDSALKINSDKFGDFGSFLSGAVGALWSLVSVILFYVTLRMQRKELAMQRVELELTRNELQGQKDQMIEQNKTLNHQKFETTFFQLLGLYYSIVQNLDLKPKNSNEIIATGRDSFHILYNWLHRKIFDKIRYSGRTVDDSTIDEVINAFDSLYEENRSDMSHYFRTVYHIFKFIHTSEIQNKRQYVGFVRAQLSSFEQILIFYNCLHENGVEKFKPLIEDYGIFKNIDGSLMFHASHRSLYKDSAYQSTP